MSLTALALGVLLGGLLALAAWAGWRLRRHASQLAGQVRILEALVDGTPHPIYIRDRQGRLLSCNDSYLKTFGCSRQAVLGHSVTDGVLPCAAEAQAYQRDYQQVMASGTPYITDRGLTLGDRALTLYHWILPYRDGAGQVCGVVCGWVDISERQRLLEQCEQARNAADAANAAKSQFLATLSHEIRTPMNALLGLLELALQQARSGHADAAALEVAQRAGQGMLGLIGDVLDLASIEAGQLSARPEPVALAALVEDTANSFAALARRQGLALQVHLAPAARATVEVDPLRLRQVLSNLIGNAIKYTPRGQVSVKLEASAPCNGFLQVRLCVNDTGVGISKADQAKAFRPFTQFHPPGAPAQEGAGLGLAICRELTALLGGQLALRSEPGVGTQVCLSLALRLCPQAEAQAPAPARPLPALRVLVVDDHPANRLVLARQLQALGLAAEVAENGASALRQWQAQPFDLVIADCNMPGLDGYGLAQAIRAAEAAQGLPRCTVLGYTANAQASERQRCLGAGMDGCLFKPLDLPTLRAQLEALAPVERPCAEADSAWEAQLQAQVLLSCQADREALAGTLGAAELEALGHRIKGMARIIGALPLAAAAQALEDACAEGAGLLPAREGLITALGALEAEYQV
ncbi:ATP-binding protein [Pseudomonas sp. NPDC007930]|uniref:ATP-binding protein n=1 Tax=Pseudomonas sp. NPDC007930 TaxID=3364417 RepID=UPI0036E7159C